MFETWKAIPKDERYEVSNSGRVRMKGKFVDRKLVPLKNGYLTFMTMISGKSVCHYAHRSVFEAFVGPVPPGMHVCHNNGDRTDNRVSNLRLDTPLGNIRDKQLHGTQPYGEANQASKLTIEQVRFILRSDSNNPELARKFGVARDTIGKIRRGETWTMLERNDAVSDA